MPFWKYFINTKPEVDDGDLPLPKHRLFDDEGNFKSNEPTTPPQSRVSVTIAREKISPKKSTPMSPKTRAKILRSVGATPTAPRRGTKATSNNNNNAVAEVSSAVSTPKRESTPRRSVSPKKSSPTRATSSPKKSSPTRATSSPKKSSPTRATSSPKKSSPTRATSSPKKSSPTRASSPPNTSVTPRKSTSPGRAPAVNGTAPAPASSSSSSPTTSPSKSSPRAKTSTSVTPRKSQSKRARSPSQQPEGNPSPRWTVNALRAYAKDKSIDVSQDKTKAEILSRIEGHATR